MSEVEHLRCQECDHLVSTARFDGVAKLVCHCTHVDGAIDPVPVDDMAVLPDCWEFILEVKACA